MPSWASRRRRPRRDQAGVGIISSAVGFLIFMVLLLVAVQVSFDLYERSMLGAVATDAARIVAGSDAGPTPASLADAESLARGELGRAGPRAAFQWNVGTQDVELTVSLPTARFLPGPLAGTLGLASVSRSARYRWEVVR